MIENFKFPSWVCLHGLPLEFWNENISMSIANSFGQYCATDKITKFMKHLFFARFCVFVEKNEKIPTQITFSSIGAWVQQIDYEDSSIIYLSCGTMGHTSTTCVKNKKHHFVWKKKDYKSTSKKDSFAPSFQKFKK